MKKLMLLLLLFTGIVNAQIVNIPDANFKAKLLSSSPSNTVAISISSMPVYIDSNFDGEIQQSEAAFIKFLDVSSANIFDLTGIEFFINLNTINCGNNQLTSLNLSNSPDLNIIDCYLNQLSNLDFSNFNLSKLVVSNNPLVVLTLNNVGIGQLNCNDCNLTTLDITNASISQLNCSNNQMTNLIMTNNSISFELNCENNLLTNLNLNNSLFSNIWCGNNLFNSLDFSTCINLGYLKCNDTPTLTSIFIKNGRNESVNFDGDTNLEFICADESQISQLITFYPSIVINSYCSFYPGGGYNSLTGSMIFDSNNNGCDANDIPHQNIKININDGTNQVATFTNNTGNYNFYTQSGNFTITPAIENPTWFNFSPTTATIPFADNNNNIATQDFCISANGVHPNLEIVVAQITPARPGFDATYKIVYKNTGNQTLSGNVYFYYDDTILDFVSADVAPVQTLGLLTWAFTDILPFEARSYFVTLNVNSPQETPAVNIGDQLFLNAASTPINGNEIIFSLAQTVVGSYDPNDITCIEGDTVDPSSIGNYLHYVINFENTGNYAAENVVVKDIMDTTKFDVNSLQLLESSSPVDARITGNVVEFIFKNIQLAGPGGHGNILLKIKTKPSLVVGEMVSKNVGIYFDYNAPVNTLPAETTFQTLGLTNANLDASIAVFPNPTSNFVNIKSKNTIQSIQLFDVQGRLLQTNLTNQNETKIDISEKSNGVYFLKITSEVGMKIERIIKQ